MLTAPALLSQLNLAKEYYYTSSDTVFSSWKDSDLRKWLIDNGVVKSDFQANKDKYVSMVGDNYKWTTNELYSGWTDSDLRSYLIQNGWIKSDFEAKRDEYINLAQKHGNSVGETAREYINWSDARLKAYLRQTGLSADKTPTTRKGLLREMRARFAPQKGFLDQIKEGVQYVLDTVQDAGGKAEQKAKVASVSASSASRCVVVNVVWWTQTNAPHPCYQCRPRRGNPPCGTVGGSLYPSGASHSSSALCAPSLLPPPHKPPNPVSFFFSVQKGIHAFPT